MSNYIDKEEMLQEFIKYNKAYSQWTKDGENKENKPVMGDKLNGMIIMIATNYANSSNFSGYTWKEDMIAEAISTCLKYCHNFDPYKYKKPQPFSYITTICYHSFLNYIEKEKNHSAIKRECYDMFMEYMKVVQNVYGLTAIDYENLKPVDNIEMCSVFCKTCGYEWRDKHENEHNIHYCVCCGNDDIEKKYLFFDKQSINKVHIKCKNCENEWFYYRGSKNTYKCDKCGNDKYLKVKHLDRIPILCNSCGYEWKDNKGVGVSYCIKCGSEMLYKPLKRAKRKKDK